VNKYGGGVIGRFNHQMQDLKKLGWLVSSYAFPCWVDPFGIPLPQIPVGCFLRPVNGVSHMEGRCTTSKVWLRAELVRPRAELLWRAAGEKKHTTKAFVVCFYVSHCFFCLSQAPHEKYNNKTNMLWII